VFDLYAPHKADDALSTTVNTPSDEVERPDDDLPFVGGSASVSETAVIK
jgi:alpha-N-arabinofuranosidase